MDKLPYGVDTIVLRITWPAPRVWRSGYRWDSARGARPPWAVNTRLTSSPDVAIVPVADKEGPANHPLPLPFDHFSQRPRYDPDARPATVYPLPLAGTNENPFLPGDIGPRGGSAPGGRASLPPSNAPPAMPAIPNPASPEPELRLRRELERSGQIKPGDRNEAHHLVSQGGLGMIGQRDPSASQGIMRRFDIDLNSVGERCCLVSRVSSPDTHERILFLR